MSLAFLTSALKIQWKKNIVAYPVDILHMRRVYLHRITERLTFVAVLANLWPSSTAQSRASWIMLSSSVSWHAILFYIPPGMLTLQLFWAACSYFQRFFKYKIILLWRDETSCVLICAYYLPSTGTSVSVRFPLQSLPSDIYIQISSPWDSLRSLSLFLYGKWSCPFILFVAFHWTQSSKSVFLLYWGAQNSTLGLSEGKNHSVPQPASNTFLIAVRVALAFAWVLKI